WKHALTIWEQEEQIELYEEAKKILTKAICRWTGVPTDGVDMDQLSEQLGDMYEAAEKIGMKHFKGELSRKKTEKWLMNMTASIREGKQITEEHTPLYNIATHRDVNGDLLDEKIAAVEVLNLLRPTVAISVYIVLIALALHDFPEAKEKLIDADAAAYKRFVQETRRYYPFFPVAPAIVKQDFL